MLSHSSSSSQYIRPDYLSPLPSSLDVQKSPLAMLAATCNSIGAPDLPKNIKNVDLPPTSSSKKSSPISTGGSENKRPRRSPDVSEKFEKKSSDKPDESKPEKERDRKEKSSDDKAEKSAADRTDRKSSKSPSNKSSCTSPLSKPSPAMSMSPFFPPPSSSLSDPLNFASRLKQPQMAMGGMMPYCRDPFCFGCSQNLHCGTNSAVPMDYSALSSYSAALANGMTSGKYFTCNWISPGESPCGKRFTSGEELFAHLRTHTNLSVPSLSADPLQSYASYAASYFNRFPSLVGSSRYNPSMYKSPISGVTSPMGTYGSLWPGAGSTPFFSPSPYSYYRPPF